MEFFGWLDDGDNKFEKEEKPLFGTTTQSASIVLDDKTYVIGDAGNGNSCKVNQSRYVGIYWCAGNLSVNLSTNTISCDGSTLGNEAQTDSMSVDVSIRAMPSKENPKFLCGKDKPRMMETTTMMKTDQEVLVSRESRAILEIQENLEYEKISSQYSIWSLHSSSCWSGFSLLCPASADKGKY